MNDPRAVTEFRVPASELRPGDLVNTSPGEDDWQQVVAVVTRPVQATGDDVRALAETLDGRYVIVQLTDISPLDSGVYFDDGQPMVYGTDEADDRPVSDVVSTEDGERTYLYTRFELVTVRTSG